MKTSQDDGGCEDTAWDTTRCSPELRAADRGRGEPALRGHLLLLRVRVRGGPLALQNSDDREGRLMMNGLLIELYCRTFLIFINRKSFYFQCSIDVLNWFEKSPALVDSGDSVQRCLSDHFQQKEGFLQSFNKKMEVQEKRQRGKSINGQGGVECQDALKRSNQLRLDENVKRIRSDTRRSWHHSSLDLE